MTNNNHGARSGTIPTDIKFTGQRLDGTGLYYYGARYYDAGIGRFISPDSIVQSYANPQSLNRYAYVVNNPLKYVDAAGKAAALPPDFSPPPIIDIRPPPTFGERIEGFLKEIIMEAVLTTEDAIHSGKEEPDYTTFLLKNEDPLATILDLATGGHPAITLPDPLAGLSLVLINTDIVGAALPLVERHEGIHDMQQDILGGLYFTTLYLLADILYGYDENPFELQAVELSSLTSTPDQSVTSSTYDYDPYDPYGY